MHTIDIEANGEATGKKPASIKSTTTTTVSVPPIMTDHGQFNMCPKLDEVPVIEPLICKHIANERLTSLVFRDDCFVVSTQDGYVYTWARPVKVMKNRNIYKQLFTIYRE